MMQARRRILAGAAGAVCGAIVLRPKLGSSKTVKGWPSRFITVVAPSGVTGPSANFRLYADELQKTFGQPFVLEGVPGASGAIGLKRVLQADADGYTLLVASNTSLVQAPLV